jgi:hypothetical protein
MSKAAFCTIVTRSHFKYAVALATSLQRYHPTLKLCVLILDSGDDWKDPAWPPIDLFQLHEIEVPDIEAMKIYFNAFELSNCLKPFFIAHLLRKGIQKVVYLDADILAVNEFDYLFEMLEKYAIVLSPHWLRPELAQRSDVSVRQVVDLGIYNGGMWGIRYDAMPALTWLMQFLPKFGFDDRQHGMFVDQKMLPLVAQLFSSQFGCIEHPGYNVGYWNLHEREITRIGNKYLVNDQPAIFFHLSGFRVEVPETFTQHPSSWTVEKLPILREIIAEYLSYVPPEQVEHLYLYDYAGPCKLSPELRRHYFIHRTFANYPKVWLSGRSRRLLGVLRKVRLAR